MASAFQCDRCGNHYRKSTYYYKFCLSEQMMNGQTHPLDLCKDCKDELEEWMEKMLHWQAEHKREEVDE